MILENHMIKGSCNFTARSHWSKGHINLWVGAPDLSHYPPKFVDHSQHVSGDIMFLVVEKQDSTSSCLNLPLLFISKAHGLLRLHTRNFTTKRTLTKSFAKLLPVLSKKSARKNRNKRLDFCVTCKCKNT